MSEAVGPSRRVLRVLSWNICELRGDLDALFTAIREIRPDIMLVQEAPRFFLPQLRLQNVARRVGMRVLLGGRFGRGLAILGTDEMADRVVTRGLLRVRQQIVDANSTYPRGVAAVRLDLGGAGEMVFSCIHFALQESNRMTHARRACELIEGAGAPVVIGGDLNEVGTGPARTLLSTVAHDPGDDATQWTFPARRPQRRIDAIYVTEGVDVVREDRLTQTASVPAGRFREASDHLPVLLEIEVPAF